MSVGVRRVQGPQQGKGKGWSLVPTGSPESPLRSQMQAFLVLSSTLKRMYALACLHRKEAQVNILFKPRALFIMCQALCRGLQIPVTTVRNHHCYNYSSPGKQETEVWRGQAHHVKWQTRASPSPRGFKVWVLGLCLVLPPKCALKTCMRVTFSYE